MRNHKKPGEFAEILQRFGVLGAIPAVELEIKVICSSSIEAPATSGLSFSPLSTFIEHVCVPYVYVLGTCKV